MASKAVAKVAGEAVSITKVSPPPRPLNWQTERYPSPRHRAPDITTPEHPLQLPYHLTYLLTPPEIHPPINRHLGTHPPRHGHRPEPLQRRPPQPLQPQPGPGQQRRQAVRRPRHGPRGRHRRQPVLEARRPPQLPTPQRRRPGPAGRPADRRQCRRPPRRADRRCRHQGARCR